MSAFSPSLKWATLTAAVNEMKSPNVFLNRLCFSNRQTVPTEEIELGRFDKGREIAPFVKRNGEAVMVAGHTESFQTVNGPNIRLKRPFTPSELLFNRRPGTVVYAKANDVVSAAEAHIARDMQVMADYAANAEEYLAAMALRGQIAYTATDAEVYQITFPRPAGHNITLSVFWNDADLSLPKPLKDIHAVKRLISDEVGMQVTDAICGTEASDALRILAEAGKIIVLGMNGSNIDAGTLTFMTQFRDDGVIFLGTLASVRFWEYGRTALLNGVSTAMVRAKYVEFIATGAAADRVMYFAAIPDMKAFKGRLFQSERFAKSWEEDDPSRLMALIHTRPLPVPRRPGATVSMKVVSG